MMFIGDNDMEKGTLLFYIKRKKKGLYIVFNNGHSKQNNYHFSNEGLKSIS